MNQHEKVRILLVDDQPAKLRSLEVILKDLDEHLIQASDADGALKCLLSEDIAVVLIDVCMPRMDGFELAELIRGHPRFNKIAIIFISAVLLTDADRLRGFKLGAVDYIPVPIVPEMLRAKVSVFVDLYRKTQELERVNAELQRRLVELDSSNRRLRFTDRMATIGTLAAGLGHDMGNLLLPVRMHLDTLQRSELSPGAREDVQAIRKASEYLQRLASSLRLLAVDTGAESIEHPVTDIVEWWRESGAMVRNGVPRSVAVTAEMPEEGAMVRIGRAALTQIVFNLVQNAGDVLKDRSDGSIVVAARRDTERGAILLSVTDNGPGMDEQSRLRCLEPFFTTKTREFSTGLGLALVSSLVTSARATLRIESVPGEGASFIIEFPAKGGLAARPTSEMAPKVAMVSLKDTRRTAVVRALLKSLEFDVREQHPSDAERLDLWVTEWDDNGAAAGVRRFIETRPQSCAMVLGGNPEVFGDSPCVICLEETPNLSNLRAEISRRVITGNLRAREQPHDR